MECFLYETIPFKMCRLNANDRSRFVSETLEIKRKEHGGMLLVRDCASTVNPQCNTKLLSCLCVKR